jgi:hypothetical protein
VEVLTPRALSKLVEWGGIAFTAGVEHAEYELELSGILPLSHTTQGAHLTWEAGGAYTLQSSATTIPLEVSSNIRFAPITGYAGIGWDFDIAQAATNATLSGSVEVSTSESTETVGSGTATFDGTGEGNPYQVRGFFGLQGAIGPVKLFTQLNIGANQTYGAYAGLRVAM